MFSRTFQDTIVYSSTFQACANPGIFGMYFYSGVLAVKRKIAKI